MTGPQRVALSLIPLALFVVALAVVIGILSTKDGQGQCDDRGCTHESGPVTTLIAATP